MKHGKRELPRQHRNRKGITALTALVLIFCCTVGGTLAWLVTKTDAVTNTFQPTAVSCEVEEKFDGTTKSDVCIKIPREDDKGIPTTQAYVRATYVVNWAKDGSDNTNTVYAVAPVKDTDYTLKMGSSKWTKSDGGYYYYSEPVAPGESTEKLIDTCTYRGNAPAGYHLQVTILAEAIQADGIPGATSAQAAWENAAKS